MACRLGTCKINNNTTKSKNTNTKIKKARTPVLTESSSDWSDSDDSCSGCSACWGSSSTCSCSECNLETDSSDDGYVCAPKPKKTTKAKKNNKILQCKDGVCEWVTKKQVKKPTKPKAKNTKAATKTTKAKKVKTPKRCYDC